MTKKIKSRALKANTLIPMEQKEDYESLPNVPSNKKWKSEDVNTHILNIKANNESLNILNANMDYIKELLTKVEDISTWKEGTIKGEIDTHKLIYTFTHTENNNTSKFKNLNDYLFKQKNKIGSFEKYYFQETNMVKDKVTIEDWFDFTSYGVSSGIDSDFSVRDSSNNLTKFEYKTIDSTIELNIGGAQKFKIMPHNPTRLEMYYKLKDPLNSFEMFGGYYGALIKAGNTMGTFTDENIEELIIKIKEREKIRLNIIVNKKENKFFEMYSFGAGNLGIALFYRENNDYCWGYNTNRSEFNNITNLESLINVISNESTTKSNMEKVKLPFNILKNVNIENVIFEKDFEKK